MSNDGGEEGGARGDLGVGERVEGVGGCALNERSFRQWVREDEKFLVNHPKMPKICKAGHFFLVDFEMGVLD